MSRVAIVTGGGSGIGQAVCRGLARQGRHVAVLDVDAAAAARTAHALDGGGTSAIALQVDVADRSSVDRACDDVRSRLGPIEILVTSAAVSGFVAFGDLTSDTWDRTLAVNLTGTFHCMQAAIPDMISRSWGRIVTVSSAAGQTGSPRQADYAASKGGVIALTKSVALEFASLGITANTVPPFAADTAMLRGAARVEASAERRGTRRIRPRGAPRSRRGGRCGVHLLVFRRSELRHWSGRGRERRCCHMSDRFSLQGRVAVITGGGTGIGRGTALVLAEHGADVVLAARRREPLETTASEVRALGRRALTMPTDVTSADECQQLIDQTVAELGTVDILVNNAGGAETKSIRKWTEDEWHQVLAVNLGSVWFLSRAAASVMLEKGKGSIVNISSGASLVAMPQAAPYGAAKAAVNNLTGAMAAAWTPKGVRVNTIAVGAVRARELARRRRAVRSRSRSHWHAQRLGAPRRTRRDRIRRLVLRIRRVELLLRPDALHQRGARSERCVTSTPTTSGRRPADESSSWSPWCASDRRTRRARRLRRRRSARHGGRGHLRVRPELPEARHRTGSRTRTRRPQGRRHPGAHRRAVRLRRL